MAEAHRPRPAPAADARTGQAPDTVAASPPAALSLPHRALAAAYAHVRAEPVLVGLLAFAGLFFLYRWGVDLRRPWEEHEGWRGYTDQGFYLREAQVLTRLDPIPKDIFLYGPGYPALAVPFAGMGKNGWPFDDPFLPANTLIWLLTVAATYQVGRRLLGELGGVAAALALMLATPLARLVTLPWNSTVCLGAIAVTMLVALRRRLGAWEGAALGLAVGFAYSARYVDAIWVGIVAAAIVVARARRDTLVRVLGGAVAGAAIPLLPTFYLHWRVFGNPFTATYSFHRNVGRENFDLADIPGHGLQAFVSPWIFSDQPTKAEPLLSSMFLIVLAPVGAWLLLRTSSGPRRAIVAGYTVASLTATIFYLSYYFTGSYGLQFGSLHFFKMWFPIWTLGAVAAAAGFVARVRPQPAGAAGG